LTPLFRRLEKAAECKLDKEHLVPLEPQEKIEEESQKTVPLTKLA
jgi:hypothetical protein|tara:strand:- start:288 stop:422 length:135 start_codon:yes stop_codon:yes gene_type:complete